MSQQPKKVCLITPNHISTNPRLVKEAIALENAGYEVHLIFTQSDAFETSLDDALLKAHPTWCYNALDWSGKDLQSTFYRFTSGLLKKIAERIFFHFKINFFAPFILNRHYKWQVKKAIAAKADLYIGHNLGALPVATFAAKQQQAKAGFDAEDFHRHETTDDPNHPDARIKGFAEERWLPTVQHLTAASPLISQAYQQLFPSLQPTVVLNVFPKLEDIAYNIEISYPIRLFWFSQTIGENRGLEIIVEAMKLSKGKFELHLLGNSLPGYQDKLQAMANQFNLQPLIFYNPVPEKEIFRIAATCDIGMASETGIPTNRDICLTNKIFTYIQSGLALAASDTTAQTEFLKLYPTTGKVYRKNDASSLASILDQFSDDRVFLADCKQKNYQLGQSFLNWETEQEKYISCVTQLLTVKKQSLVSLLSSN